MNVREEVRVDAQEVATTTILGHPDVTVPCKITNFSRSGLCILVPRDILEGTLVKVDWGEHFLVGRVQRGVRSGEEYYLGLQLLHCSQW
jgi:hypothetical protein